MPLKRPKLGGSEGPGAPEATWKNSCLSMLPSLMEFLAASEVEGQARKLTGVMQISVSGGRWQGKLRDQEAKVYCFVTADTLDELMEQLDQVAETGDADWRKDDWPGKQAKGK